MANLSITLTGTASLTGTRTLSGTGSASVIASLTGSASGSASFNNMLSDCVPDGGQMNTRRVLVIHFTGGFQVACQE